MIVSSGYSGRLEYRIWSHTGTQPNFEEDEYVPDAEDDDLWRVTASGDFVVSGLDFPLFWSFQARVVDVHDVASEPSGVVSMMVWGTGLLDSNLYTRISGMLDLPPRDWDLPAVGGGVRPDPPDIQAVDEVLGMPGQVRVTMRSYSGALQLRRWLHTGRLPVAAHEGAVSTHEGERVVHEGGRWHWMAVSPDSSGQFIVYLPGFPEGFPVMWDFQTRVMGSGGLESEPSNVISLMVWGEIAPSPTPCTTWDTRFGGPWPCFTLAPPPANTATPTHTPAPTVTPVPACLYNIGQVTGVVYRGGTWIRGCDSVNRSGSLAIYYTFRLASEMEIRIDLGSTWNAYFFLLGGVGEEGAVLTENDSGGDGSNARVLITLGPGDYTVEATTHDPDVVGEFVLTLTPSSAMTCGEGNAISASDASLNPLLAADCEALLSARDVLARSVTLDWSPTRSIFSWDGVHVTGPLACYEIMTELDSEGNEVQVRVMCPDPARVTALSLAERGLTGIVPSVLGDLSALRRLDLDENALTGSIPPSLGSLASLHTLSLSDNRLTGPVPASLGSISSLRRLWLNNNALSGHLPSSLGDAVDLTLMDLHSNLLTGPVPSSFARLRNLEYLWLSYNSLSGPIPPDLAVPPGLVSLKLLDLRYNSLTGPIPVEFAHLSGLEDLWISHNSLSGSIPPELGGPASEPVGAPGLVSLKLLDLRENDLTGRIPVELARLQQLKDLWLGFNLLTGEIPPELGGMAALRLLFLQGNDLTGEIPPELGDSSGLTGQIPPELGYLYLSRNGFTGCIPNEIRHVVVNDFGLLGMLFCDGTSP